MKAKSKAEAEQAPTEQLPEPLPISIRIGQELFCTANMNRNELRTGRSVNQLIQLYDGVGVGPSNSVDVCLSNLPKLLEIDPAIGKLCNSEDVDQLWTLLIKLRKQIIENTMVKPDCISMARYMIPAQI